MANCKEKNKVTVKTPKSGQLGPSIAVRLRKVSAYERLKNTNTIGVGCGSHAFYSYFRLIHAKFFLTKKICNHGNNVPKKSHLRVPGGL